MSEHIETVIYDGDKLYYPQRMYDALTARVAELEKDAARLDWCLRAFGWRTWYDELDCFSCPLSLKRSRPLSTTACSGMQDSQMQTTRCRSEVLHLERRSIPTAAVAVVSACLLHLRRTISRRVDLAVVESRRVRPVDADPSYNQSDT